MTWQRSYLSPHLGFGGLKPSLAAITPADGRMVPDVGARILAGVDAVLEGRTPIRDNGNLVSVERLRRQLADEAASMDWLAGEFFDDDQELGALLTPAQRREYAEAAIRLYVEAALRSELA